MKKHPSRGRAHLHIIPLGAVDALIVSVVAANIQAVMGLKAATMPIEPTPEYAYQPSRRQYGAIKIIGTLASRAKPTPSPLILGITFQDIATPILTFVFGESQIGGRAALISLYRIMDADIDITCTRAAKIGLHEVGHLLGIGHCRTVGCLMRFSDNLEKLDKMQLTFCPPCMYELSRRIQHRFTIVS